VSSLRDRPCPRRADESHGARSKEGKKKEEQRRKPYRRSPVSMLKMLFEWFGVPLISIAFRIQSAPESKAPRGAVGQHLLYVVSPLQFSTNSSSAQYLTQEVFYDQRNVQKKLSPSGDTGCAMMDEKPYSCEAMPFATARRRHSKHGPGSVFRPGETSECPAISSAP